jgi:hypothetical protein
VLLWGDWVVLGVAALLLISWELMMVAVVMLGSGCWMLLGEGVLLDGVDDLLFVVSYCWLY